MERVLLVERVMACDNNIHMVYPRTRFCIVYVHIYQGSSSERFFTPGQFRTGTSHHGNAREYLGGN